jgi:acyl-CoA thioester hydrolase
MIEAEHIGNSMSSIKPSVSVEIQVAFYDLDPMQIVWHGNYLKYFEVARCALLETFDYGYVQMKESGYMWPIVDSRIKFINAATFDQKICCTATLMEYENRIKIDYKIVCLDSGKRLTKGYTTQVAVNLETKELQLVSPQILFEKLAKIS